MYHLYINQVWLYANIEILKCELLNVAGKWPVISLFYLNPHYAIERKYWNDIVLWILKIWTHTEHLMKNLEWLNFFLPHLFNLLGFPVGFVFFKLKIFHLWWALLIKLVVSINFYFILFFFFYCAVDRYFESCASNYTHWRKKKYTDGNSCLLWYNCRSKHVKNVKESKYMYFWLPFNIL